jgi:NCS1 family nucleobase:cation symporter-1
MSYTNEDLAVVPPARRNWGTWNYAALWISMSLCIPTYMLASSLIEGGMNWWEAILTVLLGNSIVLIPMILNGHAGARYGIPFPVFARASFGIRGANVAAILRAIVACGWFGIQTWIGGASLYQMTRVWVPGIALLPPIFPPALGLETGPAITFLLFWFANMAVVFFGIESIRKLLLFKAAFLPAAALALLAWALVAARGLGPILSQPSHFQSSSEFWTFFFPALTGMVGYWATLSLNIPDFTRFARSQRSQILGQAIGLPPSMTAFAFIGVVVTSATTIVFGKMIWDPVQLAGRFESRWLVTFAMAAVVVSTLATNIAANIVSPANDFSNLAPSVIDFRRAGYLTGIIGIVILPWKLVNDPSGYIFTWLIAYSSLLGPIGGILIADYYFIRHHELHVDELYRRDGRYWYTHGFHLAALTALGLGIVPSLPGFLSTVKLVSAGTFPPFIDSLYHYAWFVGFGISATAYYLMTRATAAGRALS